MTSTEFNFKYRDYLEEGHYGLAIDIPSVVEYLDNIFKDLIKIPDFKYSQIKSKFGMCRFYTSLKSSLSDDIEEHVNKLMNEHTNKLIKNQN